MRFCSQRQGDDIICSVKNPKSQSLIAALHTKPDEAKSSVGLVGKIMIEVIQFLALYILSSERNHSFLIASSAESLVALIAG